MCEKKEANNLKITNVALVAMSQGFPRVTTGYQGLPKVTTCCQRLPQITAGYYFNRFPK